MGQGMYNHNIFVNSLTSIINCGIPDREKLGILNFTKLTKNEQCDKLITHGS